MPRIAPREDRPLPVMVVDEAIALLQDAPTDDPEALRKALLLLLLMSEGAGKHTSALLPRFRRFLLSEFPPIACTARNPIQLILLAAFAA